MRGRPHSSRRSVRSGLELPAKYASYRRSHSSEPKSRAVQEWTNHRRADERLWRDALDRQSKFQAQLPPERAEEEFNDALRRALRSPSVDNRPTPTMERLTKPRDSDYFKTEGLLYSKQRAEEDRKEALRRAAQWPQEISETQTRKGDIRIDATDWVAARISETRRLSTPKMIKDRSYERKQQKRMEARKRKHWEKVLHFPDALPDERQKEISQHLGLDLFKEGLKDDRLSKPRHDHVRNQEEKENELKKKKRAWRAVLRGPNWDAAAKFEQLSKVYCEGELRSAFDKFQTEREVKRQEEEIRQERWQRTLQMPTSLEQLASIDRLSQPRPSYAPESRPASAPAGGSRRSEPRRPLSGAVDDCGVTMDREFTCSATYRPGSPRGRWMSSSQRAAELEETRSKGLMPVRPTFEGATRHLTLMDACRPQGRNSMPRQPGDQYGFDMYIPC